MKKSLAWIPCKRWLLSLNVPPDSMFPWMWRGKYLAVFLAAITSLIILSFGGALLEIFSYFHAENQLRTDRRIVEAIDRMSLDIGESRMGRNGYLLSGQTAYLVIYTIGIEKLVQDMSPLRRLLERDSETSLIVRLDSYRGNMDLFQSSHLMETRGLMETRKHFLSLQGKGYLEELSHYVKGIRSRYVEAHSRMRNTVRDRLVRSTLLFGSTFIFFTSFLWVTSIRILKDISKVDKLIASLHHDASHDPLTGLPNRAFVMDWLAYGLSSASREKGQLAILYIDLDRFKEVNDRLGHDKGDMALLAVTNRFRNVLRGSDVLARLGGDEFVLIMSGFDDPDTPSRLAGRLLKTLEDPIALAEEKAVLGASIGVAVYPGDGKTPEILMKKADQAMYRSKGRQGNCISFASEDP
jgi:diguanylate cyclase (GGDEF)-like protein